MTSSFQQIRCQFIVCYFFEKKPAIEVNFTNDGQLVTF